MKRAVVVRWRRGNVGGESLVLSFDSEQFTVATGPSPWGTGSWGPFPSSCIIEVRELRADDAWQRSGSPAFWRGKDQRWTARHLLDSLRSARTGMYGALRLAGEFEQALAEVVEAAR